MAKGKKTPPEVIFKIMTMYAATENISGTARELGMPFSTVRGIIGKNKTKPEFTRLKAELSEEFAKKASDIIGKGLSLLVRRFDRAIDEETELDFLIDEILAMPKTELTQDEKSKLVTKLRALQLQDIKAITSVISAMYDKSEPESRSCPGGVNVEVMLPPGADIYAE